MHIFRKMIFMTCLPLSKNVNHSHLYLFRFMPFCQLLMLSSFTLPIFHRVIGCTDGNGFAFNFNRIKLKHLVLVVQREMVISPFINFSFISHIPLTQFFTAFTSMTTYMLHSILLRSPNTV